MAKIRWKFYPCFQKFANLICIRCKYIKTCFYSLTYNSHMSAAYATDVCLEPMFWIVDNYTRYLGRFFVVGVAFLTIAVVIIAYWIGLPFWWNKNPIATILLLIVGNWLLVNVVFNYILAVKTPPGQPPEGEYLFEAVSICKKCITPKPPRTHHCSVCKKCILKMDHHCPWLNNCVGFGNHRYFFLYMVFTTLGCLFLIIFGLEIGYNTLWSDQINFWEQVQHPEGYPVTLNSSGHLIALSVSKEYDDEFLPAEHDLPTPTAYKSINQKRALFFMALTNVSVLIALGALSIQHAKLISRGETSIEAHINQSEYKRLLQENKIFINPYDFGIRKNWEYFLNPDGRRSFWRSVLFPNYYAPTGDGFKFRTIYDEHINKAEWL